MQHTRPSPCHTLHSPCAARSLLLHAHACTAHCTACDAARSRPACVGCTAFSRTLATPLHGLLVPAGLHALAQESPSCASPGFCCTASCSAWHCLLIRCAAFSRPLHGQLAHARDAAGCTYILYFWYIQCRSYFFPEYSYVAYVVDSCSYVIRK